MKQIVVVVSSIFLLILNLVLLNSVFVQCQRPKVVKVGAIFSFDTVIGRVAKPAMEAAVADINKDPRILSETQFKLDLEDANCSVFLGFIDAFHVIAKEVVSLIGPQSSAIAHVISHIANGLQVPLISFAATDPTLSALQFPFFVRTARCDLYQMAAMADLVDFHVWKEVIAIYVDDEYGRNGIAALDDELNKKMARIAYKFALPVQFNESDITNALKNSITLGPRVYVIHVNPDPRLRIFRVANELQMMTDNYVWLATDWLSATIDSFTEVQCNSLDVLQGVVGLRQHSPDSSRKRAFVSGWREMKRKGLVTAELNAYGLQAYDTVWTVAYAIDSYIKEFQNISFSQSAKFLEMKELNLQKIKIFDGGTLLLKKILETNFTGLSGQIKFDESRNVLSSGYEVINIDNKWVKIVGYWSNISGLSLFPPERHKKEHNGYSRYDQELKSVTWPGGKTEKPRGWVIADDQRPLRIGVPNRASFVDFVTERPDTLRIEGYCIDVFLEARKLVPYDVPYLFVPFGDGRSNPSYDELVNRIAEDVFDAVVGDIAIVTNRTKSVDFSQPYADTGLVVVAPISNRKASAWVFLKPFTVEMWCVTAASFVMIAVVIWILERRVNDDFRGTPKRQLITMFMFSFSTLFKKNQETTRSPLGRMVMVVWLFLLMVITASYTASLTSILTVQQLPSTVAGIDSLIASNWPIGYQVGSFAYGYLSDTLYVHPSRLVSLRSPEEYEEALRKGPNNGGVAAIVDELPYVELFLSNQSDFAIIGRAFTRGGWGFAFQRDSPLAIDISTAILKLSEIGELQKIRQKWFCNEGCPEERSESSEPNQLRLISFWGLYLLCGAVTLIAFSVFLLRMVHQYVRYKRQQRQADSSSSDSSKTHCSHIIFNFLDFIDKKDEAIKTTFNQSETPQVEPQIHSET